MEQTYALEDQQEGHPWGETLIPMHESLLATKLFVPSCPTQQIVRERLLKELNKGLSYPLTLLSATAGLGKTTLLASWVRSSACTMTRTAWVNLDDDDNDPKQFWRYVLTALEKSEPGTGMSALQQLCASEEPFSRGILMTLINTLAYTTTPLTLILDDYQAICNEQIHQDLVYVLEHLPSHVHIVIATRTDPLFPLSRWRGYRKILELRTPQLSATEEEVAAYFSQVMHMSFTPSLLTQITAYTDGWLPWILPRFPNGFMATITTFRTILPKRY
jgi:LuxR family transcriptional regulator, maltose regulon positive regulatory protein